MDLKFIAPLLLIGAFMGMTAAQASCDPETQYEKGGRCCLKCKPGTSMSSPTEDCENPRCQPCAEDHYQDTYTVESKCRQQPYCDENKNFEAPIHKSATQRSTCKCKLGFHCSSEECITCVQHTLCQPGFGAKLIGNESQDTVCAKCSEGTFNNDTSWNGLCHKWTVCETGYHVEESGTDTADNKCARTQRRHIIVISIMSVVLAIGVVVLVVLYRAKCIKQRAKGYFEPQHAHQILQVPPIETILPMTPEENEDDPSHELSSEGFTEKGNQVMQERGKEEIVSRQESQFESQLESQEDSHSMDQCIYRHN